MNPFFIQMLFTNKLIKNNNNNNNNKKIIIIITKKKEKKKKKKSTCGHGLLERKACGIEAKKKNHKQAIFQAPKVVLTHKWKFACCILSLKVMCTVAY